MSNLWAFFPICQAQGLLLKMLLICTCWYSFLWHWSSVGFAMPGRTETYGGLDTMFSAWLFKLCFSWFQKETYHPTEEDEKADVVGGIRVVEARLVYSIALSLDTEFDF